MSSEDRFRDERNELARLRAEADQRDMQMRDIVIRLKAAIKAGDYSMEMVKADIVEMGLSEEGAAVLISCLEE